MLKTKGHWIINAVGLTALGVSFVLVNATGTTAAPKASTTSPSAADITQEIHVPQKVPPALAAYSKSPTHAKRQAAYAKAWNDQKADLKYDDGSKQSIQLRKSPYDRVLQASFKTRPMSKKKTKPDKALDGWVTSSQKVEMTATSSTFMNNDYADAAARIYPGAIFTANDFEHGDYKQQAGERNAIDIATDNPNVDGSSSVSVKHPDVDKIRDAVATLYHRMKGKAGTDGFSSQVYESSDTSSMAMQISGGASCLGISASDAFNMKSKKSSVYLTVDATLPLFSITATPTDKGFFADQSVENTPDLAVISNVVYGVRVLANVTITFTSSKDADDFHASLDWGIVSANVLAKFMTEHSDAVSTLNAYIIGGNAGNAAGVVTLDSKAFMNSIRKVFKGATYENARPISYQLSDMAGDILQSESLTEFTTVASGPKDYNPKIAFIDCVFFTGQDGKDDNTNLNVYLYPPSYPANPSANDLVGAVYGYESQGNSTRFGGGQENWVPMIPGDGGQNPRKPMTVNDLVKQNGGRVRIHIYPDGNDTWWINKVNLVLHFEDKTMGTVALTSPSGPANFVISQDVTIYDLVFTGKDVSDSE